MAVKFTNNAATTLAAGINSSVTSIAVTDGSVFPTITGSDHFYVTFDDTTNKEIVKVTARSGNTLTVVRGHDNTTARAFSSGDKAELRIVAALLEDVKTDISSTLTVDTFTGDDSTTAFTLSVAPASEDNLIVFIEGVYQNPGDFTLSGTTLTLDVAPLAGRKIIVYHVSHLVAGNNLTHNQFTCNGSTTAFTLSLAPGSENNTQAFLDGVYQQKTDYAVSGTTLTMDTAPANGAILEVMTFTQTDVNTLPASFVSGLTQVTAVGADHFMIFDATDSQLKKSLVSDVLESATSISTSADATAITIDSNEKVTFTSDVTTGGHLSVGGNNNELRFYEGANYVGFEAPALSADKIWVLPAADGSSGQALTTNGSGTLSFSTISGGVDGISTSADATAITIDSSERIGMPAIGQTHPVGGQAKLGINSTVAAGASLSIHRHYDGVFGGYLVFQKSRNTDITNLGVVSNNDILGSVEFTGADGNSYAQGAHIRALVDGTPGDGDMPTRLTFSTSADGSGVPTERLRILSSGGITFNGDTAAANALDDYEEGTWTPAFYTYSGVTTSSITITLATYTKIGNICHIHANITATLSSLPGQTVTITGLPFAASGSDQYAIINVGGHTVNTGANTPKAHFRTNGSQLDGVYYNASSNTAYWTYSSMDAQPFEMSIHGFYTTT